MNSGKDTKESGIGRFTGRVMSAWQYVSAGVWSDPRRNWWIKILRTLNLSVQSFLNRDKVVTGAWGMGLPSRA